MHPPMLVALVGSTSAQRDAAIMSRASQLRMFGGCGFANAIISVMMLLKRSACSWTRDAIAFCRGSLSCIARSCERPEMTASGLFIS